MSAKDVKEDRKYTKDHEWAKPEGKELVIGISAFAVDQLGDITLVNLDVQVGDSVQEGKAFGTIESVKTLSDLFAPVNGRVTRVNSALLDAPETINEDCWGKGWMIAIEPSDGAAYDGLLDPSSYGQHLETAGH